MLLDGWYSPLMVVLSVVIAVLASYTALDLAARVNAARGRNHLAWVLGGAIAMGVGIWSMHFVGMLAFHLPIPIAYSAGYVVLSALVAIMASGLALYVVSRQRLTTGLLAVSGLWMGPAIAGMHYIGMAGMRVGAKLSYDPSLVAASVAIAVVASFGALWLAYRFRADESRRTRVRRIAGSLVMGGAIAGMHYTGMAAAIFTADGAAGDANGGLVATGGLTFAVAVGTGLILALGLLGAKMDRWFRSRLEHEERRREAQKLEAIGQLAGGIAHDFNNILTAIDNYAAFVAASLPPDSSEQSDLAGIREAASRAAALTAQLLAFGRRQVVQPAVLDLREVLDEAGRLLRRLIGEHIKVAVEAPPPLSPVLADRAQLIQVVLNLAINARDAMPNGGRLTIEARDVRLTDNYARAHLGVDPGRYVELAVTDTGEGMPPEVQSRIFEPFFTTKPRGVGTGLGLSTVFGIVKQSGGHIYVYSETGRGTTVKVYLPRASGAAAPAVSPVVAPPKPGTETILVVEDDPSIRALVQRVLSRRGYTVLTAAGPGEAIALAAEPARPIHLLLTDVMLPEMTGPDLAKIVAVERARLPVIYMSGYTDTAIVHRGQLSPGSPFLPKPFGPEALLEKVREVLDEAERQWQEGVRGQAGATATATERLIG
jgi:NO-binding membrane sensor protein with MHYT domain/nitrogen-specific signal transduction histidine kinase/FixJ family two-component response regulator